MKTAGQLGICLLWAGATLLSCGPFEPDSPRPTSVVPEELLLEFDSSTDIQGEVARNNGPCLEVTPTKVHFGGVLLGDTATVPILLESCSDEPLELQAIHLFKTELGFAMDLSTLDSPPTKSAPLVLKSRGDLVEILVDYSPKQVGRTDLVGKLDLDQGLLALESNGTQKPLKLELEGFGVDPANPCPLAAITCKEGHEIGGPTTLHLSGEDSTAFQGEISDYKWSVVHPGLTSRVFSPSANSSSPTFPAMASGTYEFTLWVMDSQGVKSCQPATYVVEATKDAGLHIELTWDTPEDPDETDTGPEKGSDLDLHFLHPWAAGPDLDGDGKHDGWFDIPFDCFWFNAHPNWGSYDPAVMDDPGLIHEDTDGAGPEVISLFGAEDVTYKVGVHYWNDHGYGAAFATVKVYIGDTVALEIADVMLVDSDMWEVCTISAATGVVEVITEDAGQYKITPSYHNPYFYQ